MQHELDSIATVRPIHLLGINNVGAESGNPTISVGRTIPWLQDVPEQHVVVAWQVDHRDVVILDARNRVIRKYNLTEHSLLEPANYAELKSILIAAANAPVP